MAVFPAVSLGFAFMCASAAAAGDEPQFPPEQIQKGAALFARHCATCHGIRMRNPEWAFDLRNFSHDAHTRFVNSVSHGKSAMPPWGGLLKTEEIEALWAYVMAGEK